MFIEQRHQGILDILQSKGSITTGEIQDKFGISYDSAKRDLRILEEKGLLKRTHGGAIPARKIGWGIEAATLSAGERVMQIKENYDEIAKRAVAMIEPDDVVFITGTSVGSLMTKNMSETMRCTVVTNSISIAESLRKLSAVTVVVAGGEMSASASFHDYIACETLRRFKYDKAFITSACITAEFGLSVQKTRNLAVLDAVMQNSKKVVGLYPTEKIGFDSIVKICPAERLDILITDWDASEDDLKAFDDLGVEILVTDDPKPKPDKSVRTEP